MSRRGSLNRPPRKRDRNGDGWELIGFYIQHNGIVALPDREVAAAMRWRTPQGVGDGDRVKLTRAHVNNKSRRERDTGAADRTFAGWYFGYRDIKGSPSVLKDDENRLLDPSAGLFALLGDRTRFTQHTTERERVVGWAREAAEHAVSQGRTELALAWLDYEHDIKTFSQPKDATVERLRELLAGPPR